MKESAQTKFDDEDVSAVYASSFGAQLFNAYTLARPQSRGLFSRRLLVVRRMLRAMLDAEAELGPMSEDRGLP